MGQGGGDNRVAVIVVAVLLVNMRRRRRNGRRPRQSGTCQLEDGGGDCSEVEKLVWME